MKFFFVIFIINIFTYYQMFFYKFIEQNREFCFGGSDFNVEKSENGFYKVKMINDKDLWFVDNEGKSEYLVLSL